MAEPLSREELKGLVLAAIERIRYAEQQWRETEQNPASSELERIQNKRIFSIEERDFYVQWKNVEELLNG